MMSSTTTRYPRSTMMIVFLVAAAASASRVVAAFMGHMISFRSTSTTTMIPRRWKNDVVNNNSNVVRVVRSPLYMGGGKGIATSRSGKRATVENVKTLLDTSELIFKIPASSITVKEAQQLRRSLPEGTTAKVIKNNLMKLAVEGTDYEAPSSELLVGPNMWFFVESDVKGTIEAYNTFLKDTGKKETHSILGGITEGTAYDGAGMEYIGTLPSKQELYAQIAGAIKAVPTKVAIAIKAPTSKLARAIKLATMPEDGGGGEKEE